ncbi:MAG: PolC-type DNA polymerase III, partial [Clostridia bacterium]|nr:PolC-type DNA polymerase III [Clostridia bacterium]
VNQMIDEMAEKSDPRRLKPYHATILVKNKTGLKNLYKLVSYSYLDYYYRYPRIPKTVLEQHREGLIVGSACASGEIFQLLLEDRPYGDIMKAADFYDYFEIMPDSNNGFLIDEGKLASAEDLHRLNRRVLEIADKQKKPCVATGDVHFMDPDDEIYRQLLKNGQKYTDAFRTTGMYLKTTDEMLGEFAYLGDRAYEVVVTNTRKVADMIEDGVRPIPKGTYPPSIDGAEEELVQCCNEKARRLYGDPLPEIVQKRLDRELGAIIEHHFAVLYIIARKLVANSEKKGYLVGSRGSVGSSVVAMLADISEVNPLPPHRRCPNCRYSEFFTDGSVGSGFDLDDANCPECGTKMVCDGHDIPFETFLGFKGDKAPDIDLNFSGNVQSDAHKYTETLFGKENIFRAGTVGTIAFKTAYGYVKKYLEDKGISLSKAEINRLSSGCVGVKRTTGQHPGGIIVVPKEYEVYDFTPVQHPAEKESSGVVTTHFAFEFLHDTILKLDMLGHDVPTMYKILEDYTGIDVRDVPLNDKTVYSLFTSPAALGVTPESIMCETGTLGLPEMGTPYVRGMLLTAKPKNFSDLLQISGLSHGTGIWLGNGEELIKNGTCTIDTIIGTRDSIMLTLLQKGLEPSSAFKIMESVRKGKGVSEEFEAEMHEHEVPDWYIASCRKIKYMFPKAHAAAYVLAALRLAWFKVFRPVEYYATYFSARPDGFDYDIAMQPKSSLMQYLEECKKRNDLSQKEEATADCMQIVNEMYARGISFLPVDVLKSSVSSFVPENGRIRLPFIAISGLGLSVAQNIFDAVKSGVSTVEELRVCPGVGRSIVDLLQEKGCLASLPESDQLSFF